MLSTIPLIPTLTLGLISLISSFFIILRLVIPTLPPHPFSRRVSPTQFGLPVFRTLSVAHKSHLWLTACDLIALAFFLWQAIAENTNATVVAGVAHDPGSSVRLAVALTIRQSCLAATILVSLIHIRMGRSVSLKRFHIAIWGPTLLMLSCCAALAGLFANGHINSLFIGLVIYTATLTIATCIAFGTLVITLRRIHDNLKPRHYEATEKGSRPSFATEDIDALREGSSWLTSTAGSRRDSMSTWSFSTWHSPLPSSQGSIRDPRLGSFPSLAPKSSFWFGALGPSGVEEVPPVPPLPSLYRREAEGDNVPSDDNGTDPFRRDAPRRIPKTSNDSWLTSPSVSQESMTAFSFPTTRPASPTNSDGYEHKGTLPLSSRTAVSPLPNMASAKVLGGYGHVGLAEKGLSSGTNANNKDCDVSFPRMTFWLTMIWLPFILALPSYVLGIMGPSISSPIPPVFLVISVTISSPLLVAAILCKASLPMPTNLFPSRNVLASARFQNPLNPSAQDSLDELRGRGISSSTYTVVEGRRSGDIWMSKGDAVDGKSRLGRALTMLQPSPPLSVLPTKQDNASASLVPPIPLEMEESNPSTPRSAYSAEVGHARTLGSKVSTFHTATDESLAQSSRICIAERHTSAMAKAVVLPPSPTKRVGVENHSIVNRPGQHLRSRSVASTQSIPRDPLTPPPPFPPPSLPGESNAKQGNVYHKRSQSSGVSSGFSFSPISGTHQIDALSAGMLPLLLPGVTVGHDVEVHAFVPTSARNSSASPPETMQFNTASFSSPESHSTPIRSRKTSTRKRHHFSLPSLSLAKDHAFRLWKAETTEALEETARRNLTVDDGRRATIQGLQSLAMSSKDADEAMDEMGHVPDFAQKRSHTRAASSLSIYPEGVESARSSLQTLINMLDIETQRSRVGSHATLVSTGSSKGSKGSSADAITSDKENQGHVSTRRRSRISYIRSDESTKEVPLVGRASALFSQKQPSAKRILGPLVDGNGASITPSKLRPLSLLQSHDMNVPGELMSNKALDATPPLSVKKRANKRSGGPLRPLQLARSATNKARGVLRRTEVLPQVVVRPPSNNDYELYGYSQ